MADDKSKTGEQDRSRVSGTEDYEVHYIAKQAGISTEKARELIKQHGPDRQKVLEAARRG
jgi:NACalpha-BTF3-like transcription factor